MNLTKLKDGRRAEDLATSYLEAQGYKIIAKNYRTKLGEIDVIGRDGNCVCFIEVRSVNTRRFGSPEYSVTRRKQGQIARSALSYIKQHRMEEEDCRFDVVAIENMDTAMPEIRLIKDAFELEGQYRY